MQLYRAMRVDEDGCPKVGRSARCLGVRIDGPVCDIRADADGSVSPETGGMSVTPDELWAIPAHRRPRRLGHGSTGHDGDRIFVVARTVIEGHDLSVRLDPKRSHHAFVEPAQAEPLASYEEKLANTRTRWIDGEP